MKTAAVFVAVLAVFGSTQVSTADSTTDVDAQAAQRQLQMSEHYQMIGCGPPGAPVVNLHNRLNPGQHVELGTLQAMPNRYDADVGACIGMVPYNNRVLVLFASQVTSRFERFLGVIGPPSSPIADPFGSFPNPNTPPVTFAVQVLVQLPDYTAAMVTAGRSLYDELPESVLDLYVLIGNGGSGGNGFNEFGSSSDGGLTVEAGVMYSIGIDVNWEAGEAEVQSFQPTCFFGNDGGQRLFRLFQDEGIYYATSNELRVASSVPPPLSAFTPREDIPDCPTTVIREEFQGGAPGCSPQITVVDSPETFGIPTEISYDFYTARCGVMYGGHLRLDEGSGSDGSGSDGSGSGSDGSSSKVPLSRRRELSVFEYYPEAFIQWFSVGASGGVPSNTLVWLRADETVFGEFDGSCEPVVPDIFYYSPMQMYITPRCVGACQFAVRLGDVTYYQAGPADSYLPRPDCN